MIVGGGDGGRDGHNGGDIASVLPEQINVVQRGYIHVPSDGGGWYSTVGQLGGGVAHLLDKAGDVDLSGDAPPLHIDWRRRVQVTREGLEGRPDTVPPLST